MFRLSKIMSSVSSSVHQAPFQGSAAVTSQLPSSWMGWGAEGTGVVAGVSAGTGGSRGGDGGRAFAGLGRTRCFLGRTAPGQSKDNPGHQGNG